MTSLSNANASRFNGLRDQTLAALKKVNAAALLAAKEGRVADKSKLVSARSALRQTLQDIDAAEDAFIRSSMTVAEAEAQLKDAGEQARAAVAAMADVAAMLQRAADLVALLGRLTVLFG